MHNPISDNAELVQSRKVIEMITVAHEYCLFIEKIQDYGKAECMIYLSRIMPLLYLKASLLPDLEEPDNEANEKFLTEEQWLEIYKNAGAHFGTQSVEFVAPGQLIEKTEVAELLADLYQEMKDFVLLYTKEIIDAKINAVYWLKYYFKLVWGKKCVLLLGFMHEEVS